jgi:hypothetical protein
MSGVEGGSTRTTRMTPLRNKASGSGRCSRSEVTWRVGGPLLFGFYDCYSAQGKGGESKGGRMRTINLSDTEVHAAGLDLSGEPRYGGLTENRWSLRGETSFSKRLPQGETSRTVIV